MRVFLPSSTPTCQREPSLALADAFMSDVRVYAGNELDLQLLDAKGSPGAVSGIANVLPRLVQRLVRDFDQPGAAADMQRAQDFLAILGGYGMTAAFKGIMASLHQHPGWRRVRPPLVTLDATEVARLEQQIKVFGIDTQAA